MLFKVGKDKLKEYEFNFEETYDEWIISGYAIDCHYPSWDSEGIESSDLESRIEEYDFYMLKFINLNDISKPIFSYDDYTVEEYAKMNPENMPPIILDKINNKYVIIDGTHRYYALKKIKANKILSLVPIDTIKKA